MISIFKTALEIGGEWDTYLFIGSRVQLETWKMNILLRIYTDRRTFSEALTGFVGKDLFNFGGTC